MARSLPNRRRESILFRVFGLLTIVLLCAILFMAMCAGRIRTERQFIAEVEKALFCYHLDFGEFPQPGEESPALQRHSSNPYFSRLCRRWPERVELTDHWGRPLRIRRGKDNPGLVDIQSLGPNGRDEQGKGDDVKNWP